MKIILGSTSPRRKEILEYFSLPFEQVSPQFDEEQVLFKGDPKDYALELAKGKLASLIEKYCHELIITADTVVYFKNKIYNKPKNAEEACQFLEELCGNWHSVFTAVAVQKGNSFNQAIEETRILFHNLTSLQIKAYQHYGCFRDKAGGYAIQKCGSLIISRIEGCYYNVMGLPINTLYRLLLNMGINLWDHLKPF